MGRIENLLQSEEQRAKKIETLIALLRDPDLSDFASKLLGETLTSTTCKVEESARAILPRKNGYHAALPASIRAAMRIIGPDLPHPFSVEYATRELSQRGFLFRKDPKDTVRDALYALVRGSNPSFRITEQGTGGRPNQYEHVDSKGKEATKAASSIQPDSSLHQNNGES